MGTFAVAAVLRAVHTADRQPLFSGWEREKPGGDPSVGTVPALPANRPTPMPWAEFFEAMVEGVELDRLALPNYAVRRASIYEDHP